MPNAMRSASTTDAPECPRCARLEHQLAAAEQMVTALRALATVAHNIVDEHRREREG